MRCSFSISWCFMLDVQTDVISYVDKKKAKVIAVNAANPVVKGAVSIFVFLNYSFDTKNQMNKFKIHPLKKLIVQPLF